MKNKGIGGPKARDFTGDPADLHNAVSDAILDQIVADGYSAPADWSVTMDAAYNKDPDSMRVFLSGVRDKLAQHNPSYNFPKNKIGPTADADWNKSVDKVRLDVEAATT